MIVTKFNYPIEKNLLPKLDLMIDRCIQKNPKRDAVLLIEGAEGEGKTTMSVAVAYYVAEKTKREFSHNNIFFDIDKMIKFLQSGEGKIAIWDEPALQSLSGDSLKGIVKNLKRMLMMCRNKRHFIIINMTYFTEFGNYIVWQRPLGMIHVYSRDEKESGRFIYIKKSNLENLWNDWRIKKKRNYRKYSSKNIRGSFPDVMNPDYKNNVLSEFNFAEYEKAKNEAIQSIGNEDDGSVKSATMGQLLTLKYLVSLIPKQSVLKIRELAKILKTTERSLQIWHNFPQKYPFILANLENRRKSEATIIKGTFNTNPTNHSVVDLRTTNEHSVVDLRTTNEHSVVYDSTTPGEGPGEEDGEE